MLDALYDTAVVGIVLMPISVDSIRGISAVVSFGRDLQQPWVLQDFDPNARRLRFANLDGLVECRPKLVDAPRWL
jgi:hypothetical protein